MTDNIKKFAVADRIVGYRKAAVATVNLAEEFRSRGVNFGALDEILGGRNAA